MSSVDDFLSAPDSYQAQKTPGKRPTLKLPSKGKPAAAPKDAADAYLDSPDKFKAPATGAHTDSYAPEGGAADYLYGGLQGAYNTARGIVMSPVGQAAGLADIPVHAAGTAMGMKVPEPEDVEQKVSGAFKMQPKTRTGERASQLVEEGAGDILGSVGAAARWLTESSRRDSLIEDYQRKGMNFTQARAAAEKEMREKPTDPERLQAIEDVSNNAALLAGARGAKGIPDRASRVSRGTDDSDGPPPPPTVDPEFVNMQKDPAYKTQSKQAPEAPKTDQEAGARPKLKVRLKSKTPPETPASPKADTVPEASPSPPADLGRALAGTNARLEPFAIADHPPDIQWNSVELEPGYGDVRLPQRNLYASPADDLVQRLGESQYPHAIRGQKFRVDPAVLDQFRRYGQAGEYPWWQEGGKGMLANIAHAVEIATERRQIRQRAYRELSDRVGTREMLKNPQDYALTFDWREDKGVPRKTEVVCGIE